MSLVQPPLARRVVVVVLDGLRADLIGHSRFPALAALRADSAHTMSATTVLPSVTAAAMTSLLTGVGPARHGMDSDRFRLVEKTRRCVNVPGGHCSRQRVRFCARSPMG
jgi:predicted AlkP superfamily pyrophosphatase or phosphodiesterase